MPRKQTNKVEEKDNNKKEVKKLKPITERIPWAKTSLASDIPLTLEYFDGSMYDKIESIAKKYPNLTAFYFMGRATTYKRMCEQIQQCAKALKVMGLCTMNIGGGFLLLIISNCFRAQATLILNNLALLSLLLALQFLIASRQKRFSAK